ncbi:alpha/beta fold hydrolase [Candidatus Tisiphia endosymbiont of Micropterix aruncella]|uniref:S9 family peptidase n=1 Tax=Candidatus Tisiphia endosymbiont of Micropterix aruncella TaxID=3066271 RepID=UPI003AA7CED8
MNKTTLLLNTQSDKASSLKVQKSQLISIILTFLTLVVIFISNIPVSFADHPIIQRQILFSNPDKAMVTLSPDGQYISYLAPKDGVLNLWIGPSSDPSKAQPVTDDKDRGIESYAWTFSGTHILYAQDNKGDENFRIYAFNLKTQNTTLLTPARDVKGLIYGISERIPNEILIGINDRDKRYFDIYKVNLLDNTKKLVIENNKFSGFIVDDDLQIRFATFTNQDGGQEYFEFKDNNWIPFMTVSVEDSLNTRIIGFDKTGTIAYLLDSRESNTAILKSLDLKNGKSKIIAKDKRADVKVFTSHPTEKTIQAVAINYDKTTYNILDDSIKSDIEYLKEVNPGKITINTRTLDDQAWLVAYLSDVAPVKYYQYDRNKRTAKFLFSNRENLEKYKLAEMFPVVIKARDGLDLVSYITFPTEVALRDKIYPNKPMPLVLYVHGGPWARDSWGLSTTHQWLANRGYAVLSVNFRGSTGFGKNFINAGNMQWGRKMHDDLIDAVNWAIENKIADPKKVAIMGGSYGGYATLVGLTFPPDIFACGVDIVGPSSLLTLIKSVPPYWEPILNSFKKRIGPWDTKKDIETLDQMSPLTFASRIKKPLFIAQGANDPRVKQTESDQIVKVMQGKNIPVIYALYNDEGHGFVKPENRLSYYALIEQFLAKILGGRAESIGEDLKGANFLLNGKTVNDKEAERVISHSISSLVK